MPGFFSNPSDFAFFLMGIVGSVIVGYQMLSGSFFGHNASKGEIYTTLIVLASLVISLTGWMYVFKERANKA